MRPTAPEVALWSRYADAPFVAVSTAQARLLADLNVVATIHHAVDIRTYVFREHPDDYLLFLGRYTEGKGVLEAIDVARRVDMRIILAAAENDYFRTAVAPLVDQRQVISRGEVDLAAKVELLGGARALLYPIQSGESFGLVLAEANACGTPVAALDCGAVREIVDDGVTGRVFGSLDALADGVPEVLALDRVRVRARGHRAVRGRPDGGRLCRGLPGRWRPRRGGHGPRDGPTRHPMTLAGRSLLGVFAHPDDESLASGRTIGLLRPPRCDGHAPVRHPRRARTG